MYSDDRKVEFETYLEKNNHCFLSILLHEDVGVDHVRDHTTGARWIGTPVDLDLDFLQQLGD